MTKDKNSIHRNTIQLRQVQMEIPNELRLGQAIVNALGHLHRNNQTISENMETALFYVSDEALQKSINEFHKPYGFGHAN
jgi:hypothetical protein